MNHMIFTKTINAKVLIFKKLNASLKTKSDFISKLKTNEKAMIVISLMNSKKLFLLDILNIFKGFELYWTF